MDGLEFRRRLGAEPHSRAAELLAHRDRCAACAAAWERAQAFERELHAALEVSVPEGLAERFYAAYRAVFSAIVLDEPLEIVNWKLEASGPEPMRDRPFRLDHASSSAGARIGERQAYVPGAGLVATPVYDRYRLDVGAVVTGPAIIEERESTTVLGHHDSAHIDPHRNLVIDIGKGDTGP